jgi:hypothetical protein
VSVSLGVAGVEVEVERPVGPGALADDLAELLVELAAAMSEVGGVALVVDEAQVLPLEQLAALLGALHAGGQRQLPMWAAMAGLPNLLSRAPKRRPTPSGCSPWRNSARWTTNQLAAPCENPPLSSTCASPPGRWT